MDHLRLVPLATGLSQFEAKVLTARLGADGIIWQLRGAVDSIYPIGEVDVLVPAAELDDARAVLSPISESESVTERDSQIHSDGSIDLRTSGSRQQILESQRCEAPSPPEHLIGEPVIPERARRSSWIVAVVLAIAIIFLLSRVMAL